MNQKKIRLYVINALLAAICLILGLTSLGYIPIGPVQITLMCIPVIVGTLTLGLKSGVFLGAVFALTSILQIFIAPSPIYSLLFVDFFSWVKILLICIVPRLLIPVFTYFTHKGLKKLFKGKAVYGNLCVSSVVASLTNTIFFLGMFWLFFSADAAKLSEEMYTLFLSMFTLATTINAGAELAFACIVCPPIILAVRKIYSRN